MSHAPNPQDQLQAGAYHGHPRYVAVWAVLVIILFTSLGIGAMGNHALAVAMIFGLAIVKAVLVLGNFMHLRWEPRLVWLVAGFGVLCIAFLYFGVFPDIVWVPVDLVK